MALGIGDTLSVKITGDSSDLNRAIDAAQRNLEGLDTDAIQTAAALQLLSSEADDASDEIRSVGTSSIFASGGLTSFFLSTESAGFAVRGLSSSIVVSLLPALAALSAALVPIVTSLGGFAAIAGSIGGLGLIGALAAIATRTKVLKFQVQDIAQQLEQAFAPAIDRALLVIQALLGEFENIIPQLVPAQSTIEDLGASFFRLGKAVINLLPSLVELAVSLADEFLPPFVAFVQNVGPKLPGIIRDLVADFERLLPKVLEAGRLIARIIPPLTEFGFTVLNVLGPALASAARAGTGFLRSLNSLSTGVQQLVAALSLAFPVIAGVALTLGGPVAAALTAVIAGVVALNRAWQTNFLNIRGITQDTVSRLDATLTRLEPVFTAVEGALNNLAVAWNMVGDEILTIATAILDGVLGVFTTLVDGIASGIVLTTQLLTGNFAGALKTFAGFWKRTFRGIFEFITEWGDRVTAAIFRIIASVVEGAGTNLANFLSSIGLNDAARTFRIGGTATADQLRQQATRIEQRGVREIVRGDRRPVQVGVRVEGDTDVVRDVTVEEISRRERQQSQRYFAATGNINTNE